MSALSVPRGLEQHRQQGAMLPALSALAVSRMAPSSHVRQEHTCITRVMPPARTINGRAASIFFTRTSRAYTQRKAKSFGNHQVKQLPQVRWDEEGLLVSFADTAAGTTHGTWQFAAFRPHLSSKAITA